VPADTGIVPWVRIGSGVARPLWTADSVTQHYRPGTNVVVTIARFGRSRVRIAYAAGNSVLACLTQADEGAYVVFRSNEPRATRRLHCDDQVARQTIDVAAREDRRWLARAQPLAPAAPGWATRMYERSLLVLRALTDRRGGAVAAGARDGWAYVWPRDAATAAMAFAAAGYPREAERTVRFLLGLGLDEAARFHGDGSPVPGRAAQGDATGWVAAASKAAGLIGSAREAAKILGGGPVRWRNRRDYWEDDPGDYLGNALASRADVSEFSRHIRGGSSDTPLEEGLVRVAGDPDSGLDSAAAWAVRPFPQPYLYPAVRATLNRLVSQGTTYGLTPGEDWPGTDPWSAPTAWTAWSLAALGERRQALRLLADLRRAATPAGTFPERVGSRTGIPASTTPLAWSHAFTILALRQLWPAR
jgi:glucoamylase